METFVRGGSLEAILDTNGDAVAAWEIVDQFQPAMTKDAYLALQPDCSKRTLLRASGVIVEVPTSPISPSRSIGLRIAKEIEPETVGLFLIGAVMTLQTGSDVKFQPRLIEGIRFDGEAQHPRA
jgi:hypothetical protein